jgi:DNA-binding NtrC family response regulator
MKTLKEIRHDYILSVLKNTGWDIEKASGILQVSAKWLRKQVRKLKGPCQKQGYVDEALIRRTEDEE